MKLARPTNLPLKTSVEETPEEATARPEVTDQELTDYDVVPEFRDQLEKIDLSKKFSIDLSHMQQQQQQQEPQNSIVPTLIFHVAITFMLYLIYKYIRNVLFG